jgi:hypothetical protein
MIRSAKQMLDDGRFDSFAEAAPHPELNAFFRADAKKRGHAI